MQLLRRNLIAGLIIFAAALVFGAITIHAGEPPRKIRVIYTNDTMGYVDPCG